MSTRSIAIALHRKAELMQLSVTSPLRSLETGDCQSAAVRGQTEGLVWRFGVFLRECWRRMMVMHAAFEQAGNGARSRERSEERLRDEEAWSRMDDPSMIMKCVSIAALLTAVLWRGSVDHRVLLSFVMTVSAIAVITQAARAERRASIVLFLAIITILNPVLTVALPRHLYLWTDLTCLAVFIASLAFLRNKPVLSIGLSPAGPREASRYDLPNLPRFCPPPRRCAMPISESGLIT